MSFDFVSCQSELQSGCLLKFAIADGGLSFVDGKLEKADLHYLGKSNRARMFADSYSKVGRRIVQFTLFWILPLLVLNDNTEVKNKF